MIAVGVLSLATVLTLLLYLAVFGLVVYLIVTYIPMPAPVRTIIIAIAVILLIIWLIGNLGGLTLR